MSEKDGKIYKKYFHDFEQFKGCFGDTRIMPMDVDGIVEKNGYFLVIEYKPNNKDVSEGQHRTLLELSKLSKFKVVVFWHIPTEEHTKKTITAMQIYPNQPKIPYTDNDAINFCKNWFRLAKEKKNF